MFVYISLLLIKECVLPGGLGEPTSRRIQEHINLVRLKASHFVNFLPKEIDQKLKFLLKCGLTRIVDEILGDFAGELKALDLIDEIFNEILNDLKAIIYEAFNEDEKSYEAKVLPRIKDRKHTLWIKLTKWSSCYLPDYNEWDLLGQNDRVHSVENDLIHLVDHEFGQTYESYLFGNLQSGKMIVDVNAINENVHGLMLELHNLNNDFKKLVTDVGLRRYILYAALRIILKDLHSDHLDLSVKEYCHENGGDIQCRAKLCSPETGNLRFKLQKFAKLNGLLIKFCGEYSGALPFNNDLPPISPRDRSNSPSGEVKYHSSASVSQFSMDH